MARAATDPRVGAAFREWLLRAADDELIIGHRHSEWTGFGPDIESDVAFSSIAQEEVGHARAFYAQIASGAGEDEDHLAFARRPGDYRHAVLVERENGGWEWSIVRLVRRRGQHTPEFDRLHAEMTEVWRSEPEARW